MGTAEIQPPDAKVPKPFRSCAITVGDPIDPARYADHPEDHLAYRQLIDEVMFEIRELTGQEYRDVYATKRAEALPAEPAHVSHVSEPVARRPINCPGAAQGAPVAWSPWPRIRR